MLDLHYTTPEGCSFDAFNIRSVIEDDGGISACEDGACGCFYGVYGMREGIAEYITDRYTEADAHRLVTDLGGILVSAEPDWGAFIKKEIEAIRERKAEKARLDAHHRVWQATAAAEVLRPFREVLEAASKAFPYQVALVHDQNANAMIFRVPRWGSSVVDLWRLGVNPTGNPYLLFDRWDDGIKATYTHPGFTTPDQRTPESLVRILAELLEPAL